MASVAHATAGVGLNGSWFCECGAVRTAVCRQRVQAGLLRFIMIKRIWTAADLSRNSCFLWGPRQTGKSTLLRELFPNAPTYDLLSARE
jgi:hypothetical protein